MLFLAGFLGMFVAGAAAGLFNLADGGQELAEPGDDDADGDDRASINPGPGNLLDQVLTGDGVLVGGDGDDLITGGAGNDDLTGGAGDDTLYGLEGDDWLFGDDAPGSGGDDWLFGGEGDDTLVGNGGNDYLDGGPGDDKLF
ncbi:MAG: calcium-binding protein, partial [Paracoccus sp. (in: a-proteobacteria)]|nr:calcium-binding protein [Paracoccus sp. (in: a-proteobacteria)]